MNPAAGRSSAAGGEGGHSATVNAPLAFAHARDPACRYWEERRKNCQVGASRQMHCHVLATLYRQCPG
jgi:hypothetical protein